MMSTRRSFLPVVATLFGFVFLGWKIAALNAYESAKYTVIESDSPYEIREYPDLMIVTTKMASKSQSDDGSFMRLFRYISGANDNEQKVAMTTPVFMEAELGKKQGQMGFVVPEEVAAKRVPEPTSEQVQVKKRAGGKFAVIQFNGQMNSDAVKKAEDSLRNWINNNNLIGDDSIESAGYDPPWTPGPRRRSEVLIRLKLPAKNSP
jgi:DNA gyrase inhibitor GyrI